MDIPFDDGGRGNADDARDPQVDATNNSDSASSHSTDMGDIGDLDAAWWESLSTSDDEFREAAIEVALHNDLRRLAGLADNLRDDPDVERRVDCEIAAVFFVVDRNRELYELLGRYESDDVDDTFAAEVYCSAAVASALTNDVEQCRNALSLLFEESLDGETTETYSLASAIVLAEAGVTAQLLSLVDDFSDPDHEDDYHATLAAIGAAYSEPDEVSFLAVRIANQGLVHNVECSVVEARVEMLMGRGELSISSLTDKLDDTQADKATLRYTRCVAKSYGPGALVEAVEGVSSFDEILCFEIGYGCGLGGHQLPSDIDAQLGDPLLAVAVYQGAVLGRQRVLNELRRKRAARES
jgi:hypothetical protein